MREIKDYELVILDSNPLYQTYLGFTKAQTLKLDKERFEEFLSRYESMEDVKVSRSDEKHAVVRYNSQSENDGHGYNMLTGKRF